MVGRTLGHYEILEQLGAGGMGEVYLAHDSRLNRTVALKLLRQGASADPERRRRFVQEAQAASALDHSGIVTIHDIVDFEGRQCIVMQYVKGRTLRDLIGDRLGVSQSLDYAMQIADALDAAHAAGIVHRDLKPDNVIVDASGHVKILDFGLAKLTESGDVHEAETSDGVHLTREGQIVGTAAYMSPEQAQGKMVDARSDIFSFGSVLYEMVTGKRAFEGDNLASVMAAIIRDKPPSVTPLVPKAPAALEALLSGMLAKDPAQRISSMSEVRSELKKIQSQPGAGTTLRMPRWAWAAPVPVLVVLLAALLLVWVWGGPEPSPLLSPPSVVPVTSLPGGESCPVLSPDGSRVAFLKDDNVYWQLLSGGDPLALTDTSDVQAALTWTPDGQSLTYIRSSDTEHTIYSDLVLGGDEKRVTSLQGPRKASFYERGLSWSPNGEKLAHVDRDFPEAPQAVFLYDQLTGGSERLTNPSPEFIGDMLPAFSPDGERVAFVRMRTTHLIRDIFVIHADGGDERQLTTENGTIDGVDWSADGRSVVYSMDGDLYRVPSSGGDPHRIEGVVGEASWPSVSRSGSFLVYTQNTGDSNIWRAPGPMSEGGEPERFFGSTRTEMLAHYSPDGRRIAFASDRSGRYEIWACDADGSNSRQLTTFNTSAFRLGWSPDSKEIVFDVKIGNDVQRDLYRINAEGGRPVRLTEEASVDAGPSWSRDGEWIYFISTRTGSRQVWKIRVDGSEATQLTQNGGWNPVESFDGEWIYFAKSEGGEALWRLPTRGGSEELVIDNVMPHRYDVGEYGIAYFDESSGRIELLDPISRSRIPLAAPGGGMGSGISISPDGRWVIHEQVDNIGADIMKLENFR